MRNFQNPDSAIRMEGVEHCVVEACTIKEPGAFAIGLYGHGSGLLLAASPKGTCDSSETDFLVESVNFHK